MPIQICTKCLIPATYPGTVFNEQGICNHCREYKKPKLLGEEAFLEKINSKRGDNYDCVMGISGGKDSCYEVFPIRCTASADQLNQYFNYLD